MRLFSLRSMSSARTLSISREIRLRTTSSHFRNSPSDAPGKHGLPALLLTLQHMAFDDYVRGASALQRREWGKVQGRFEDVSFIESAEQSLRLVAGAFEPIRNSSFEADLQSWASAEAKTCERLGLARFLPGGQATLANCYPLHPITLLTLPEMCARFGQHGRTLFSFLTSREPHSAAEFLESETSQRALAHCGA